jgi:hypothetical protein
MNGSILPHISISDFQKRPRSILDGIQDYAVIQSHGHDLAFVLHPTLGKILLESGMLEVLKQRRNGSASLPESPKKMEKELTDLIGNVLRELSKR